MSASRFAPATDGLTVYEPSRDLTWTREDVGGDRLTYDQATAAVAALNEQLFAGFADWRLPTIEELFLLADRSRFSPAIDTDAFPACASEWYWSDTLDAEDAAEFAWIVHFHSGYSGHGLRGVRYRVRAVRGPSRQ
jgi:hypothetical protein